MFYYYFFYLGGAPNYFPNSFGGASHGAKYLESRFSANSPDVERYNSAEEDNFSQVKDFWTDVRIPVI